MRKKIFGFLVLSLLLLVLSVGPVFSQTTNFVYAENDEQTTDIPDLTNGDFTIKIESTGRKTEHATYVTHNVTTLTGQDVLYYCFNWKDLQFFTFKFVANLGSSTKEYRSYQFVVSTKQTEDMETPTESFTEDALPLLSGDIVNNGINIPNLLYYIDSTAQFNDSSRNRAKGHDFGLYKFDFQYSFFEDDEIHQVTMGCIYFAVMPEDIDTIPTDGLAIRYSVSSSNELMNVYNLYVSAESSYKYVNPAYIKWEVVGKDKNNVNYVLTEEMKQGNPLYTNYHVIYSSQLPTDPIGPTFTFDSLGIEGLWKASCIIYTTSGVEKTRVESAELSTYRTPHKSYLWLILSASLGTLLVGGGTFLVIYKKKKN